MALEDCLEISGLSLSYFTLGMYLIYGYSVYGVGRYMYESYRERFSCRVSHGKSLYEHPSLREED